MWSLLLFFIRAFLTALEASTRYRRGLRGRHWQFEKWRWRERQMAMHVTTLSAGWFRSLTSRAQSPVCVVRCLLRSVIAQGNVSARSPRKSFMFFHIKQRYWIKASQILVKLIENKRTALGLWKIVRKLFQAELFVNTNLTQFGRICRQKGVWVVTNLDCQSTVDISTSRGPPPEKRPANHNPGYKQWYFFSRSIG